MRGGFDLEHAQFSADSDEQIRLPESQKLDMYNQQYMLVLNQAKNFFADCKDCISRLVALHSMDFGFNLPFILTTVITMQNKWINQKRKSQQSLATNKKKLEYSQSFYSLLHRMGDLIGELIDLEVDIKKNYMGMSVQKPQRRFKQKFSNYHKTAAPSTDSGSSSDLFRKQIKKSMLDEQEEKNQQNEQKIRDILKKNMKGATVATNTVCKLRVEPLENIERLSSKMDSIRTKIKTEKEKQQRVWQNFNKRKPSGHVNQKEKKTIKFKETRILDDSMSVESEETITNLTKNTMQKEEKSIFCT